MSGFKPFADDWPRDALERRERRLNEIERLRAALRRAHERIAELERQCEYHPRQPWGERRETTAPIKLERTDMTGPIFEER